MQFYTDVLTLENIKIDTIHETDIKDLRYYAKKHTVLVYYTKPKDITPTIMGDILRLRQVFQNLIENAIRYCQSTQVKKCSVEVFIEVSGTQITIQIADNGIGIPKQEQSKIFKRFYRASNAIRHDSNGSGLGLSTAKAVIEQLGGTIRFESKENKGTTFYVTLPVVKT